jgi:hypothetical protein
MCILDEKCPHSTIVFFFEHPELFVKLSLLVFFSSLRIACCILCIYWEAYVTPIYVYDLRVTVGYCIEVILITFMMT